MEYIKKDTSCRYPVIHRIWGHFRNGETMRGFRSLSGYSIERRRGCRVAMPSLPVMGLLLLFSINPDWVTNLGETGHYPDMAYLTGFGVSVNDGSMHMSEVRAMAIERARADLAGKLQVYLETMIETKTIEDDDRYQQFFSSVTQATTQLSLQGLSEEIHIDRDEETAYVLAYVRREDLIRTYRNRIRETTTQIESLLEQAGRYERQRRNNEAVQTYARVLPLYRQLEEDKAVINAAHSSMTRAFEELDREEAGELLENRRHVREAINRLLDRPVESLDDLAWQLAWQISVQLQPDSGSPAIRSQNVDDDVTPVVYLLPFAYQDTGMGSAFSRYFLHLTARSLGNVAGWQVISEDHRQVASEKATTRERAQEAGAGYYLSGHYWETPAGVRFTLSLHLSDNGALAGSAELLARQSVVNAAGLPIRPDNYEQAGIDRREFERHAVSTPGLDVDVWTNRGSDNLVFREGDSVEIYVRVNRPSHIRFIYHLADGTRALLLDNHHIPRSQVNKPYKMPYKFRVVPPFGAEFLQVYASSEPMDPVRTVRHGDFDILAEDLAGFLEGTRGLMIADEEDRSESGRKQITETRLTITTVARRN